MDDELSTVGDLVVRALEPSDLRVKVIAFEELVTRFQAMAYALAYARLRDRELAEEAVQEAFLSAWLNLDQLNTLEAFPGWFRRIVSRHASRIARTQQPFSLELDQVQAVANERDEAGSIEAQLDARSILDEWLAQLPEHERVTVLLYYIGGSSQAEVGRFLGVAENTVKQRLHSARKRLRGSFTPAMEDEMQRRKPSKDYHGSSRLRSFRGDYAGLAALLERSEAIENEFHPDAIDDQAEWLFNRRKFENEGVIASAYMVFDGMEESPLAYGCIEKLDLPLPGDYPPTGRPGECTYRVHLVVAPEAWSSSAATTLLERLEDDARRLGGTRLWSRDTSTHAKVLDLLASSGFREMERIHEWHLDVGMPERSDRRTHGDSLSLTSLLDLRASNDNYLETLQTFWATPGIESPAVEFSLEDLETRLRADHISPESFFIALDGSQVLGVLSIRRPETSTPLRPTFRLRVVSTKRGQGVEHLLLEASAQYARAQGYHVLTTFHQDGMNEPEYLTSIGLVPSIQLILMEKTWD